MNTLFPKFQNNLEKTENTPTPDVLNKSKNIDIQQTQTQQEKVQKKKVATQKLVALYCGSRFGNNPIYKEKAIQLSESIAQKALALFMVGQVSG